MHAHSPIQQDKGGYALLYPVSVFVLFFVFLFYALSLIIYTQILPIHKLSTIDRFPTIFILILHVWVFFYTIRHFRSSSICLLLFKLLFIYLLFGYIVIQTFDFIIIFKMLSFPGSVVAAWFLPPDNPVLKQCDTKL